MYQLAKSTRAKLKNKARQMAASTDQKVDSSNWSPSEPLNADVKTGMRPISRRAYKKGGKVMGECDAPRADRKPRKAGGRSEATAMADAKVNRNVKEANEKRDGIKHIGGMNKGGIAKKLSGGALGRYIRKADKELKSAPSTPRPLLNDMDVANAMKDARKSSKRKQMMTMADNKINQDPGYVPAITPHKASGTYFAGEAGKNMGPAQKDYYVKDVKSQEREFKKGGIAKRKGRKDGGLSDFHDEDAVPNPNRGRDEAMKIMRSPKPEDDDISPAMAARMRGIVDSNAASSRAYEQNKIDRDAFKTRGYKKGGPAKKMMGGPMVGSGPQVSSKRFNFSGNPVTPGQKSGGKVQKHEDVKEDKALIKKMVRPSARTGKESGGPIDNLMMSKAIEGDSPASTSKLVNGITGQKKGGRIKRKTGGGVFTGPGYPGKVPGVVPGGRTAHAGGGKAGKGKTNINIVIAGNPQDGGAGMPPKGMTPQMGQRMPIPAPAPAPVGMPPMPMGGPPPMPPMPMPPQGPAQMGPAPRKSGGRLTKVAHSYKDMEAGAGGGEGRLQKTDIAKSRMGRKVGGRAYHSYMDMDAGAGSGRGRLEKAEIQRTK
jgi:hypothetical protein